MKELKKTINIYKMDGEELQRLADGTEISIVSSSDNDISAIKKADGLDVKISHNEMCNCWSRQVSWSWDTVIEKIDGVNTYAIVREIICWPKS